MTTIFDTQPGESGSGDGYVEIFDITINDLIDPVFGVHMDLFVVQGDGTFDPLDTGEDMSLVNAFAPFSHDALFDEGPGPDPIVPEPSTFVLSMLAFLGLLARRRLRR